MTGKSGDPTGPCDSENGGKTGAAFTSSQIAASPERPAGIPHEERAAALQNADVNGVQLAELWLAGMRLREQIFEGDLFSDPIWDILLDLHSADARNEKLKITSLSLMAHAPPSTTGRWARILAERGLIVREKDPQDRRRMFVHLSDEGRELMRTFFRALFQKTQATIQFPQ